VPGQSWRPPGWWRMMPTLISTQFIHDSLGNPGLKLPSLIVYVLYYPKSRNHSGGVKAGVDCQGMSIDATIPDVGLALSNYHKAAHHKSSKEPSSWVKPLQIQYRQAVKLHLSLGRGVTVFKRGLRMNIHE